MFSMKSLKLPLVLLLLSIFLNSCGIELPGADARKYPPDPKLRVAKNIEEGRGFRLMDKLKKEEVELLNLQALMSYGELLLDTIDFMPLTSVNYSGGIIVTDWYSTDNHKRKRLKISSKIFN